MSSAIIKARDALKNVFGIGFIWAATRMYDADSEALRWLDVTLCAATCGLIFSLTQSLPAVLLAVFFALWNYMTGGVSALRECEKRVAEDVKEAAKEMTDQWYRSLPTVSDKMIVDVLSMKAGQAQRYKVTLNHKEPDGRNRVIEIVVMESADFDHILSLANLTYADVSQAGKKDT